MIVPSQISLGFQPGDVVVVTGAGRGIGRSTAINGAAIGLAVAAWDIDADFVRETVSTIEAAGGRAVAVTADATNSDQVEAGLTASAKLGPLRYLVNNAGPPSSLDLGFDEALAMSVGSMHKVAAACSDVGTKRTLRWSTSRPSPATLSARHPIGIPPRRLRSWAGLDTWPPTAAMTCAPIRLLRA